jgi:hypothetical protein
VEHVTLYNYQSRFAPSSIEYIHPLPVGTVLLLKEPSLRWEAASWGSGTTVTLRVDSPTDVVVLEEYDHEEIHSFGSHWWVLLFFKMEDGI